MSIRHLCQLGALLLASQFLMAAPAASGGGVRIDVLVFAQPGADGSNYWQDTRSLPVCHAVALREGSGAEAAFNNNDECVRKPGYDAAYGGFSATAANALPAQAEKLKAGNYTLLVNRNWQQANTNLAPVLLRGGRKIGTRQELEGTLSIGDITTTTGSVVTEVQLNLVLTQMDGDKPRYVTVQETRVITPGEINYFDHPMLGVLLQLNKVAP